MLPRTDGSRDPVHRSYRDLAGDRGWREGIGYFPGDWPPEIKAEITATNQKIAALAPALLSRAIPASSARASDPVKVTARTYNGAYLRHRGQLNGQSAPRTAEGPKP